MYRAVCYLNALMVLPFAVAAITVPRFTFAQFGLDLGPEGAGVAQGYGATALGWGIVCLLLRNAEAAVARSVLIASLAFNAAEVVIQVPVALSGIASPMIWTTIVGHGLLMVLSGLGLRNVPATA